MTELESFRDKVNLIPFFSVVLFYYVGIDINLIVATAIIGVSWIGEVITKLIGKSVKVSKKKQKKLSEHFRKDVTEQDLSVFKNTFSLTKWEWMGFISIYLSLFISYVYTMIVSLNNDIFYWFIVQFGIITYALGLYILYPKFIEK